MLPQLKKQIQNGHQYLTMLLQSKKQIQNGHQFDHATSITKQIEYSRHYRSILLRSQKQIQNGHQYRTICFFNYNNKIKIVAIIGQC